MVVNFWEPLEVQMISIIFLSFVFCCSRGILFRIRERGCTNLCADVIEGGWADDGEADEEDVGLRVGEGSESVIIFLPSSIPQTEADGLPIDHHAGRVVIEPGSGQLTHGAAESSSELTQSGYIPLGRHLLCTR